MILVTMLLYLVGIIFLNGIFMGLGLSGFSADFSRLVLQISAYLIVTLIWVQTSNYKEVKQKVIDQNELPITERKTYMKIEHWIALIVLYLGSDFSTLIDSTLMFYLSNILTFALAAMLMYPLIVESNLGLKKTGIAKVLVYAILAVILALTFNAAYSALIEGLGFVSPNDDSVNQILVETMIKDNPIKMFLTVTFSAAIMEEILFRGLSFRTLLHRNKFFAYLLTFLIFGGIHLLAGLQQGQGLSEFIYLPVYGMMGVSFAFVYDKTGSIYTAMTAHFLNNLMSFIVITTQL